MSPARSRGRKAAGDTERAPLHPLLTFQFEKDTERAAGPRSKRRGAEEMPTSIREAITRWLEEEL